MSANRARIGHRDRTGAATWSGGAWLTAYPLANLQSPRMARVARSDGVTLSATTATATFATKTPVRVVASLFDNASPRLRQRVEVLGAGSAVKYDTGWVDAFPRVFSSLRLNWSDANFWSGRPSADDLAGRRHMVPADLGQPWAATALRVSWDDTQNPDGFLSVSYVFLGDLLSFERNPSHGGGGFGFVDLSTVERSAGGAVDIDERVLPRRWSGEVPFISRAAAFQQFHEQQRAFGRSGVFPLIPEPSNAIDAIRLNMMVRNGELNALVPQAPGLFSLRLVYEEVL